MSQTKTKKKPHEYLSRRSVKEKVEVIDKFLEDHKDTKCLFHSMFIREKDYCRCCCCNRELKNKFYHFLYKHQGKKVYFYCGQKCGKLWAGKIKFNMPPFVNPFMLELASHPSKHESENNSNNNGKSSIELTPLGKELQEAAALVSLVYNGLKFPVGLYNTFQENPRTTPTKIRIQSLMNCIINGVPLREELQILAKKKGRTCKPYKFKLLEAKCKEWGIKCLL